VSVLAAAWVILTVSSAKSSSSLAMTVTVWRVFQSEVVKVSVAGNTVTLSVSLLAGVTVTSADGSVLSLTW